MDYKTHYQELLREGIIDESTFQKMVAYSEAKQHNQPNRLLLVFSILGALLTGLGLILIVAHNWDDLSRTYKTLLAFMPLILTQSLAGYSYFRKSDSPAWIESSATLLVLAIGSSISLISQIYHIGGSLDMFLLTWCLLSLPIVYIMKSSSASLLFIGGVSFYGCEVAYWGSSSHLSYAALLLLPLSLPWYFKLIRERRDGNFSWLHHWVLSLSFIVLLGSIGTGKAEWMFPAYFCLFGAFYLLGLRYRSLLGDRGSAAYMFTGLVGMLVLSFVFSFKWVWLDLFRGDHGMGYWILTRDFACFVSLFSLAVLLLYKTASTGIEAWYSPLQAWFLWFVAIFIIGNLSGAGQWLMNTYLLICGIYIIYKGVKQQHLGILNLGVLLISMLILFRFFDTQLSFVIRGLVFVGVGIAFFVANYVMYKRKNQDESKA